MRTAAAEDAATDAAGSRRSAVSWEGAGCTWAPRIRHASRARLPAEPAAVKQARRPPRSSAELTMQQQKDIRAERPELEAGVAELEGSPGRDERAKPAPAHERKLLPRGPFRLAGGPAGPAERRVGPVQEGQRGVLLDRKVAVRDADEDAWRDPEQLPDVLALLLIAADMLEHGIRGGDGELMVPERERAARLDPDVGDRREGAVEIVALAETAGRDLRRMGIEPLEEIGAGIDDIGDADVEERVRLRGAAAGNEIPIDAVASRDQEAFGDAARRRDLVISRVDVGALRFRHGAGHNRAAAGRQRRPAGTIDASQLRL